MKLKANDSVLRLFFLVNSKILTQDDLIQLYEKSKPIEFINPFQWTFETYCTYTEITNEIELVQLVLGVELSKITVKEYFSALKYVKQGIEEINKQLSSIEHPPISSEMAQAGYGNLSFGDLGLARTVGQWEGIGTLAAYDLQMHVFIKSLAQLGAKSMCDKQHSDLLALKNKMR